MLSEADILEALRVCYDPELQINIVDLGRIASLSVTPDENFPGFRPRLCVTIKLLPRNADQDSMLAAQVVNRLLGLPDIANVDIVFADAAWTPACMTAAARSERSLQVGLIQLRPANDRT